MVSTNLVRSCNATIKLMNIKKDVLIKEDVEINTGLEIYTNHKRNY